MRARVLAAGVAAAAVACWAGTARADVAPIVNDGNAPWTGGATATSPLEAVAGTIASKIAGRPVTVRCEGDADWATLAGGMGFTPSDVLGYVSFFGPTPVDHAELSPLVCSTLQSFALATSKPTKCQPVKSIPQTTVQVVRKRVGRRVVTRTIKTVTYQTVAQPLGPCFTGGRELTSDQPFWNSYFYTAEALQTLVHESIHLKGDPVEADAECYGMQWLSYAAQQLGDTPDDATAIAQYYATRLYPSRQSQSPAYWSPECRQNGALDLTPNDGVWP